MTFKVLEFKNKITEYFFVCSFAFLYKTFVLVCFLLLVSRPISFSLPFSGLQPFHLSHLPCFSLSFFSPFSCILFLLCLLISFICIYLPSIPLSFFYLFPSFLSFPLSPPHQLEPFFSFDVKMQTISRNGHYTQMKEIIQVFFSDEIMYI